MGTKIKGIYKGFKFISQIFGYRSIVVVKDHEMEIGYPTNVKHLAHIGWDGSAGNAPIWMDEFKTRSEFAARSIGNSGSALSSQDFGETLEQASDMFSGIRATDVPNIRKKPKKKKHRSKSSQKLSSSSTRSSRTAKSRTKFVEEDANISNIEIA